MIKKFNFNQQHVFLTYPQCSLSKEELLEAIQKLTEVSQYTISKETHADGQPHLHGLFTFVNKLHSTNSRLFDVSGFHPNIQKAASKSDRERIAKYIKKDGDFITNVEVQLGKRAAIFAELLEAGQITRKFVLDHPEIMHENFNNVRAWLNFVKPKTIEIRTLPKRRHLWLSGPANSGKSTYLKALKQLYYNPAEIPPNDDFSHCDENTDLLWIDEYRGQLTVQALNRLCDGDTRLNTKGGSTQIAYPRVVVCSNFTIEEVYSKVSPAIIDTIYARFDRYVAPLYPPFPSCEL